MATTGDPPRAPIHMEYLGATSLVVRGPVTGQYYRFTARGAVLPVDQRDAPAVDRVPNLRRWRPPAR